MNPITVKTDINVVHIMMFANSAKNSCILRKRKIQYIAKIVTDTDLIKNHNDVCKEVYKCKDCNKILLRSMKHKCGYSLCHNCKETDKTDEHKCYMQSKQQKDHTEWFDYGTEQDTGIHRANIIIAYYFDGTKFYFKSN
jgi:hypothetical protein